MEDSANYSVPGAPPARISGAEARDLFIREFAAAWRTASEAEPAEGTSSILTRYRRGGHGWTYCMLGDCEDWPAKPVLRDVISRYARARGYDEREDDQRIRRESAIGRFDLSFAGGAEGHPKSRNPYHFARRFELILEHENEPERIHEEVWKLLKIRADLAVLMGYQPQDLRSGADMRMLATVGEQVRAAAGEDPTLDAERFLMILGESIVPEQSPWLRWRAYTFDRSGGMIAPHGKVIDP